MKRIITYMGLALMLVGLIQPTLNVPKSPVVHAESTQSVVKQVSDTKVKIAEVPVTPVVTPPEPTPPPAPAPTQENPEAFTWSYLIGQGFTREQTAGIMGNLQQEHGFKTEQAPGGLGIAQWTGGRAYSLQMKEDHLNLKVQLDYLMEELNSPNYASIKSSLLNSGSVEEATIVFQNQYERCGDCREYQRIQYAYAILGRY